MSRVGMVPVEVPNGVDLEIAAGQITAKGKLGELSMKVVEDVKISR